MINTTCFKGIYCSTSVKWVPSHLHHEDHGVQSDHDEHRVLERGRRHKVPQSVLEGLSVLGHVAGHRLGADGKVDASPLMEKQTRRADELFEINECLCSCIAASLNPHLVLLQTALLDHLVALLLEGDDDQSHEDVDKEEREDHKVHHVENRHLHPVPSTRPHVFLCDVGRVLQHPSRRKGLEETVIIFLFEAIKAKIAQFFLSAKLHFWRGNYPPKKSIVLSVNPLTEAIPPLSRRWRVWGGPSTRCRSETRVAATLSSSLPFCLWCSQCSSLCREQSGPEVIDSLNSLTKWAVLMKGKILE